ncbi:diguanylate cyclase [Vibrio sp.]|nr:diguanylate cyclase [Vibrio sp.]
MAYENVLNSSTDSVIIIHSGQYLKTLRQIEHPSNLAAAFPAADWKDIGHKTLNLGSYSGFTWVKFTVSIGVSCGKVSDLAQAHQLLKSADAALYEAKQTGRNKVVSA